MAHWSFEPATGVTRWPPQLYRMFGLDPAADSASERQFFDFVHPEDLPAVSRTVDDVVSGRKPEARLDYRIVRRDGEVRHLEDVVLAIAGKDGRPKAIHGLVRDVTDARRREQELESARRFAVATIDALSAHICVVEPDGAISATNAAWRTFAERQGGRAEATGVGSNYFAAAAGSPELREAAMDVVSGRRKSFLHEYPCHGGSTQRWFRMRVLPFDEPAPRRVVIAHEPITDLKLKESLLERMNERLTLATSAMRLGVWEFDRVTRRFDVDGRVREIFGLSSDGPELRRTELVARIDPEDRDRYLEEERRLDELGGGEFSVFRFHGPDGSIRHIRQAITVDRSRGGDRPITIGVCADVTEEVRAAEALRRSQKLDAVGSLAAGIAHDFNNLLGIVLGNVEMLKIGGELPPAAARRLAAIERTARRGAELTRRLTGFGRIAGDEPARVDASACVGEMIESLGPVLRSEVELELDLSDEAIPVVVDPGALQDAVFNLCVNAIDAMPSGGTLAVTVRRDDDGAAEIEVADDGVGMTPEVARRATEPFFTTKDRAGGTGLGLAMVADFARRAAARSTFGQNPAGGPARRSGSLPRRPPRTNADDRRRPSGASGRARAQSCWTTNSTWRKRSSPSSRRSASRPPPPRPSTRPWRRSRPATRRNC